MVNENKFDCHLPTEHTKYEIQHEKWSKHNQWNEINPIVQSAKCIICLWISGLMDLVFFVVVVVVAEFEIKDLFIRDELHKGKKPYLHSTNIKYIHTHRHTQYYMIDIYVSLRLLRYKKNENTRKISRKSELLDALLLRYKEKFYLGVGHWHSVSIHIHTPHTTRTGTCETRITLSKKCHEKWMQLRHFNEIRVWNRSLSWIETNCQWWWSCPTKYYTYVHHYASYSLNYGPIPTDVCNGIWDLNYITVDILFSSFLQILQI